MNLIEDRIRSLISDGDVVVLRDRKSGKALNCSFTEEGLRWTVDKKSNLVYFKNARLETTQVGDKFITRPVGDLTPSKKVVVEKFIPKDHTNSRGRVINSLQAAELTFTDKALRLLYSDSKV